MTPRRVVQALLLLAAAAFVARPLFAGPDAPGAAPPKGYLGLHLEPNQLLTPERREELGVGGDQGSVVAALVQTGPAAKAGVHLGDLVLRLGGTDVPSPPSAGAEDRHVYHE